ncbi:MAG: sensor histidine kinase [Cyanobacteria bacterium RU_5_0]|nr:sensor histidine kinase [Cyanobacteria bacterium RU_5_0]
MNRSIQVHTHPFPFLLYLEWGLLAIAFLSELLPSPLPRIATQFPLLTMGSMIGFGIMGLRLPKGNLTEKITFTALEIGLILLASISGIRGLRLFPFLYVILVIRSCLIFKRAGRVIVTLVAFALFITMLVHRLQYLSIRAGQPVPERIRSIVTGFALNSTLLFGLALLFVLLLVNALLAERQSREKLAIAHQQLQQYALRVENLAMVQERNRIAREIHDSLGHSLTALNLQLEGALKLWQANPDRAQSFLRQAKQLGSTALQEVRQSVAAMRTDPLHGKSLEQAIASLVQDFQWTTSIQPNYQIQLASSLSDEVSRVVYRIVQEALTNICKHADATQVWIQIQATLTDLQLTIQDNGKGFLPEQNQSGFGIQGMRERTLALGGRLSITSAVNQGCCITVTLPLQMIEDDARGRPL